MPEHPTSPQHPGDRAADAATLEQPPPALQYEPLPTDEHWPADAEDLPRRPRRRLLSPVPATLFAVLVLAVGFLLGVQVQKGTGTASSATTGFAGNGAAAASARGGKGAFPGGGGGGFPGASGGSGAGVSGARGGSGSSPTIGEVTYVRGSTLYVTDVQGNTVKVNASGATVTKSVTTSAKQVHPGESVVVQGTSNGAGSVTATSINLNSSGGSAAPAAASGTSTLFGSGG